MSRQCGDDCNCTVLHKTLSAELVRAARERRQWQALLDDLKQDLRHRELQVRDVLGLATVAEINSEQVDPDELLRVLARMETL